MLTFKLIYGKEGYKITEDLRKKVFMDEQGFSYDADDYDEISWHIAGFEEEKVIAAARMYQKTEGVFVIGRVAVCEKYRGQYIGDTLLRALEDKAVQQKGWFIVVNSQDKAVGFYEKEGYQKTGKVLEEEGKKHFEMTKDLTKPYKRCNCKGA